MSKWTVFRQKIDFERDKQYKSDAINKYRRHIHHNRSLIVVNGNISEFISGRDATVTQSIVSSKMRIFGSPHGRTRQTARQNERSVPQLKFTCRGRGISVVGTLPVRDRPHWYLMSIRSVISNMVQSRPATSSAIVAVAREHLSRLHGHVISTHIHSHVHTYVRMRIDSLFEDFLNCDSNDCHLYVPLAYPIHSSASCHKLAFYDAAKRTMGFALNSVEEE